MTDVKKWGIDIAVTLVVSSVIFFAGVFYGTSSTTKRYKDLGVIRSQVQWTQESLRQAHIYSTLGKMLEDNEVTETEARLATNAALYLDLVHSDCVRNQLLIAPIGTKGINFIKWRQDLHDIEEYFLKKKLSKGAQQADDILKWLDRAESRSK
jgi:hypothetical protein